MTTEKIGALLDHGMPRSFTDELRLYFERCEKKAHCICENRAIHGHCCDCDRVLPEGEGRCETCHAVRKDRLERSRYCRECLAGFLLTDSPAPCEARGFCSEACYSRGFERRVRDAGIAEKFQGATFDVFESYTSSLKRARLTVQEWTKRDTPTGLYLVGRAGSGKTHLAAAALRALLLRGRKGHFVNARRFILSCQSAFTRNETAEDLTRELLKYCNFLVLDDLGSEKSTEYVRQCLLHLVDEIYTRDMRLLVTSNIEPERLAVVDPRISSRLAELCDVLKLEAPDCRLRIAQQRRKGRGAQFSRSSPA